MKRAGIGVKCWGVNQDPWFLGALVPSLIPWSPGRNDCHFSSLPYFSFYCFAVCNRAMYSGIARSWREGVLLFISIKDQATHSFSGIFFFVCKAVIFFGGDGVGREIFFLHFTISLYLYLFPSFDYFLLDFWYHIVIFYWCYSLVTLHVLPFSFFVSATDVSVPVVFPSGDVQIY